MTTETATGFTGTAGSRAAATAFAATAFAAVAETVRTMKRRSEMRTAARHLSNVPDYILRDIGIDRQQIAIAVHRGRDQFGGR